MTGTILNGAKETALEAFIEGRISFLQMADVVERVDGCDGQPFDFGSSIHPFRRCRSRKGGEAMDIL